MSQNSVETIMGRLRTDDEVRRRFAADPAATLDELAKSGLSLTWCERAALARFDWKVAERCARAVDPRLLKADLRAGVQGRPVNDSSVSSDSNASDVVE